MVQRNNVRLPWIDSLRGVAILGVILVHCAQVAHSDGFWGDISYAGQYGVQLFFVASSISICLSYRRYLEQHGTSVRADIGWLIRRFYRIAPMYYAGIVLYSATHFVMSRYLSAEKIGKFDLADVAANVLFIHTWVPSANNSVVPGGWTIGVEMMFYITVPLLMLMRNHKYFTLMLSLIAVASSLLTELVVYINTGSFHVDNNSYLYYWFPAQAPVLLMGCIFFHHGAFNPKKLSQRLRLFILPAIALLSSAMGLYLGTLGDVAPAQAPLFAGLSFCAVAMLLRNSQASSFLARTLAKFGECSFSMYILHFAILDVAKLLLMVHPAGTLDASLFLLMLIYIPVAAVSYVTARFTYAIIEVPFIEYGHKVSTRYIANDGETDNRGESYAILE